MLARIYVDCVPRTRGPFSAPLFQIPRHPFVVSWGAGSRDIWYSPNVTGDVALPEPERGRARSSGAEGREVPALILRDVPVDNGMTVQEHQERRFLDLDRRMYGTAADWTVQADPGGLAPPPYPEARRSTPLSPAARHRCPGRFRRPESTADSDAPIPGWHRLRLVRCRPGCSKPGQVLRRRCPAPLARSLPGRPRRCFRLRR